MGIVNLTPDSFSDGNPKATIDDFEKQAEKLINDGADILDIGGESTRPDADPVSVDEEKRRILPFLKRFRKHYPVFSVSFDTKKYEVAREVLPLSIQIINDVSFLRDPRLAQLAVEHHCFYVLMHARGDSKNMMQLTDYSPSGVVAGIKKEFEQKLNILMEQGVPRDRLILDLGFGFAKTPDQCVELMKDLSVWKNFHLPLLFGVSRKRFLQKYTGENLPVDRDEISAKLALQAIQQGFSIIRTHNIRLTKQILSDKSLVNPIS